MNTLSISEIKEVLDLDKVAIQEKLNGFKYYPKFTYNLDNLNTIFDFNVEKRMKV